MLVMDAGHAGHVKPDFFVIKRHIIRLLFVSKFLRFRAWCAVPRCGERVHIAAIHWHTFQKVRAFVFRLSCSGCCAARGDYFDGIGMLSVDTFRTIPMAQLFRAVVS